MKRKKTVKIIINLLIQIVSYMIVLFLITKVFKKSIYISAHEIRGLWLITTSFSLVILNILIKPFLNQITLPISALTFGLFYPFINVIILYTADYLLGKNFELKNFKMIIIIAIIISVLTYLLNKLMDKMVKKVGLVK